MTGETGKLLIWLGLAIAAVGVLLVFGDKLPWGRIPFGRLPGDITIQREGFRFSFPIVTCIIVSIVLSVLFSIFRK
jgi:formate hydrogenlyase subunit 3/multisubunit Na+/H+ antiporter MnhD subunit